MPPRVGMIEKRCVCGAVCPPGCVTYITVRYCTVSKGCMLFRNPRALGCSVTSAARALLRAQGVLNAIDPIGCSIYVV